MNREPYELVAEAFGAPLSLVPLLPALLADFSALGAWPDQIVALLGEAAPRPSPHATVVDLGCGKGAVALALAAAFGCRITGIDLFAPFLDAATSGARAQGLGDLCTFRVGDIRDRSAADGRFDVVIFSAVGAGLFGGYAECVAALRGWIRPGGHIVIGDGVLRHPVPPGAAFSGYEYYRGHEEAVRQLAAHGDVMLREIRIAPVELAAENREANEKLRRTASRLAGAHPEHRDGLQEFLTRQEGECVFLEEHTTETLWLLRRA